MGADLEIPLLLCPKFLPFVKLSWQYDAYGISSHQNSLVASMGVRF